MLTKSKFCQGLQCLRALWWRVHEPDAPELVTDAATQVVFDHGHRVGELARGRFPGGVLVDYAPWQYDERCRATEEALARGATAIYEASFRSDGVFVAVDVLERRGRGYNLVEVKSSTEPKAAHIPDVAIQLHVLRAAGVPVRRAEVMHLNRECRYPDLSNLFTRADVTEAAEAMQPDIPAQVRRMKKALRGELPDAETGSCCDNPYECPFQCRCLAQLPEHHISTLYRLGKRAATLMAEGVETIQDLPSDYPCSGPAGRQVRSVKTGRLVVEPELRAALRQLKLPIAFLDFETVGLPVPVWNGCAPYDQVPVQMSCHVLGQGGVLDHHEFLAEGPGDPRPAMAEAVVHACEGAATILAYNASFEARCIEGMAEVVPSRRKALARITERMVDLLPILRDHVYHPAFGGSFSIKSVLPALVPGLGYDDLEIQEGATAQAMLEELLFAEDSMPAGERSALRQRLLTYCERDTLAMVKLLEALRAMA